jgi:HlyD family secretion protein
VEAFVNQSESSEFRIGQQAKMHFDAFPGIEFSGKVYSIGALAVSPSRGGGFYVRNVPVRLTIEGQDPRVIPDLSASADVLLGRAENKTLIPLGAVQYEDGKPIAYVKTGETFQKRELQLGLQNDKNAVVESGVNSGEEVRLN